MFQGVPFCLFRVYHGCPQTQSHYSEGILWFQVGCLCVHTLCSSICIIIMEWISPKPSAYMCNVYYYIGERCFGSAHGQIFYSYVVLKSQKNMLFYLIYCLELGADSFTFMNWWMKLHIHVLYIGWVNGIALVRDSNIAVPSIWVICTWIIRNIAFRLYISDNL